MVFGAINLIYLGSLPIELVRELLTEVLGRLPTANASAKARVGIGTCDED